MSDLEKKATGRGRPAGTTKNNTSGKGGAKKDDKEKAATTGRGRPQEKNQSSDKDRVQKEGAEKRGKRIPMARAKKLDIDPKPGYHRHWFIKGNVAKAQAAYYDFVKDSEGCNVTRPAGNGEERLYLMEIKEEFYREDVELARQNITDVLQQKVQNVDSGEYVPEGQESPLIVQ